MHKSAIGVRQTWRHARSQICACPRVFRVKRDGLSEFRKAISLDPKYSRACTNLGSGMSPCLAHADRRFVHGRAYFGAGELAVLKSASALGTRPFSNVVSLNQSRA